jgi:hypothetical protein
MIAIDELKAASVNASTPQEADPIVHQSDGCVWTLGMVLPMWEFLFERSAAEICERKIWF